MVSGNVDFRIFSIPAHDPSVVVANAADRSSWCVANECYNTSHALIDALIVADESSDCVEGIACANQPNAFKFVWLDVVLPDI